MGGSKKAPEFQTTTSTSPYATATSTKNGTTVKLNDFLTNTHAWVENSMPGLITLLQKQNRIYLISLFLRQAIELLKIT